MKSNAEKPGTPETVAQYLDACPPAVRAILDRIRETVRAVAPDAEEKLSYRMPSFHQQGVLVYVGAFQKHIGLFPPVADEALRQEASVYAGEKGNLRFPLDAPIPYDLIAKIVAARLRDNEARARGAAAKRRRPKETASALRKAD